FAAKILRKGKLQTFAQHASDRGQAFRTEDHTADTGDPESAQDLKELKQHGPCRNVQSAIQRVKQWLHHAADRDQNAVKQAPDDIVPAGFMPYTDQEEDEQIAQCARQCPPKLLAKAISLFLAQRAYAFRQ